ncbi:MAG: hypothetical protein H0W92_06725 [Sphingomonas sp.]|nr:hypothetical protein [Sphingomonas sp.]
MVGLAGGGAVWATAVAAIVEAQANGVNARIMSGTFFAGVPPSIAANRPALKPYGVSKAP